MSLAYFLIYLVNGDNLPHFNRVVKAQTNDTYTNLSNIISYKQKYSIQYMAEKTKIHEIMRFCEVVDQMDRFEEPNYYLLKKILTDDEFTTSIIDSSN